MSFILLGILNSQAAGAVAGGSYDLLETTVLDSDTASVSFTGLGSYTDYKHLQIRLVAQTNRASTVDFLEVTLNGDTAANYASHQLLATASSVISNAQSSASFMAMCRVTGTTTASSYGASVLNLIDPYSSTKNTTLRELGGSNVQVALTSGLHVDTSAVSSVSFAPEVGSQIKSGSRFSLYGIKAA